jgi:hypothetical protein
MRCVASFTRFYKVNNGAGGQKSAVVNEWLKDEGAPFNVDIASFTQGDFRTVERDVGVDCSSVRVDRSVTHYTPHVVGGLL